MTNGTYQDSPDGFLTGTARLVGGNPFVPNTTDFYGQPFKDGRVEYVVQLAFPKDQDQATRFPQLWALMQAVAKSHKFWQSHYQANGGSGFKYKLKDGDAPEHATKEGWKGCWVITFKSGFPPQVFDINNSIIAPPAAGQPNPLPRGHFVRVYCGIKCNDSQPGQSGLYMNFNMIQRVGYGPEIISGPDFTQMLATQQAAPALPGMSSVPMGGSVNPPGVPGAGAAPGVPGGMPGAGAAPGVPGVGAAPGMPGAGAAPGLPGGMPGAGAAPGMAVGMPGAGAAPGMPGGMPGAGAAPGLPGGMPGAGAAPGMPGGMPAAAPVAETPQQRMLVNDYTYDQYIAAQWTDEMLIAQGKMRPAGAAAAPGPGALPPAGHQYLQ